MGKKKELTKGVKFEAGKSYKCIIPQTDFKPTKIHIDNVMKNPCYSPNDDEIDNAMDLITYHFWSMRKGWIWGVKPYWVFCLYNDWKYKKDGVSE